LKARPSSDAWVIIDRATVPSGDNVVRLYRRGSEFSIRVEDRELMASGVHGSEDALAQEACRRIGPRPAPRLLIGGLGMGYTLAAALAHLGPDAQVVVSEVVPAVVTWNRGPLAHLAGSPLEDPRVQVIETDVALLLQQVSMPYDSILLDVDNGPRALTSAGNAWLYSPAGLDAAFAALTPGGVLAVWSAWPDRSFTSRLSRADFHVEQVPVRSRGQGGGRKHIIWLATKRDGP
jgi:spermidine synthase